LGIISNKASIKKWNDIWHVDKKEILPRFFYKNTNHSIAKTKNDEKYSKRLNQSYCCEWNEKIKKNMEDFDTMNIKIYRTKRNKKNTYPFLKSLIFIIMIR